jgi:translocation and assembly module TamA
MYTERSLLIFWPAKFITLRMTFTEYIKNLRFTPILLGLLVVLFFIGPPSILAALFQSSSISVKLEGINDSQITSEFTVQSKLEKYKSKDIVSSRWLEKLIEDDKDVLYKILASNGRFGAHIKTEKKTQEDKAFVVFYVENVQQYTYRNITLKFVGTEVPSQKLREEITKGPFDLQGKDVNASALYAKFSEFTKSVGEEGFPFAEVKDHCATIHHDSKTVELEIDISLGERVAFGEIMVTGAASIPHEFIKNRAPWCKNSLFQRSKLNKYQDILYKTELFERVSITANKDEIKDEKIQIDVDAKERKKRTISGGAEYSLSDGVGGKIGWEHRNLTGRADKLSPSLKVSQREYKAALKYTLPDFWRVNTDLHSSLEVKQSDTKAYDEKGVYGAFSFQTKYSEDINYFYGLSAEGSQIKSNGSRRKSDNTIFGVPVGINITKVDDTLDPTKGFKFLGVLTPEVGVLESNQLLTRLFAEVSHYLPVHQGTTWANRVKAGTVLGVSNKAIPVDRRFYAGGGGSVRAYGYQLAGPLNRENKPRGGKTLLEGSSEIRQRLFDDWGAVLFVDAAYVEPKNLPNFNKDLYYGVGAGIRYYTDLGPIRLDVAFPLKKNKDSFGKNVNRPVQFYVSIGQSF